jgi:hypothetical protein
MLNVNGLLCSVVPFAEKASCSVTCTRVRLPSADVSARGEIEEIVIRDGWSDSAGAFTQYAGTDALDASSLMLPIVGPLPATDPRVLATIGAIQDRLTNARGLVYRYRPESGVDGLDGSEGTFLLCTFWLAQALAMAGRVDRAREVFDRVASHVNDLGLLAEEMDPESGELLGNFPQAFATSASSMPPGRSAEPRGGHEPVPPRAEGRRECRENPPRGRPGLLTGSTERRQHEGLPCRQHQARRNPK